jgi:dihydropyrimidinase
VGADADIVIWNPKTQNVISVQNHHSKADLNIYDGFKIAGEPTFVIKNGIVAVENGKLKSDLPPGKLIHRKVSKTN